MEVSPPLGMANDDPLNIHVFELLGSNFTSVGSRGEFRTILSSNLNIRLFFGEESCD